MHGFLQGSSYAVSKGLTNGDVTGHKLNGNGNGRGYSDDMGSLASTIFRNKYSMDKKEEWNDTADRVVDNVVAPYFPQYVSDLKHLIRTRKFMPGGRYLYAAGRKFPQCNNCFLFRAQDSRQGWGSLMDKACQSLMTGGGIGVVYSDVREEGRLVSGMGGKSTGPLAPMGMVDEMGRRVRQGGSRRSAVWAGLHWNHPDIFKFIGQKNWDELYHLGKAKDFNFPAPMDGTNISGILDTEFFNSYDNPSHPKHDLAHNVYWTVIRNMLMTGEPGFSVDAWENEGENLRNACTEVTSSDDDDMCNLASVNMGRIDSIEEFRSVVELGTVFLLAGTIYSKLPLDNMYKVREKNRRLGLGLMGIHEWLLKKGKRYGPDEELGQWMSAYKMSGSYANRHADALSISRPVATRAIAPNGTIGIIAETTSSGEPITYVALKRRYLDGQVWKAQYLVDPTADRLIKLGVPADSIEDSAMLSMDVERRIQFQAWLQQYVDHGISSTINLPPWGSELNNEDRVKPFGETLMKYLPKLRGITTYPDGARGGQPLVKVSYDEAISSGGVEFVDSSESNCKSGVCGV